MQIFANGFVGPEKIQSHCYQSLPSDVSLASLHGGLYACVIVPFQMCIKTGTRDIYKEANKGGRAPDVVLVDLDTKEEVSILSFEK